MAIPRFKTLLIVSVIAAMLGLKFCTVYGPRFGEKGVVMYAATGETIPNVVVYAEYVLRPQPTLMARLLAGMDHRYYGKICVATRFVTTNKNGEYELSGLTQAQQEYSNEQARIHKEIYGERTKKVTYKEYYKEGLEKVPCESEKNTNVVCMGKSQHDSPHKYRPYNLKGDAARLFDLDMLGIVDCYGEHAMLYNQRLYEEAKTLDIGDQANQRLYRQGHTGGPSVGDYFPVFLRAIKDRAYHPENTKYRDSIFEQKK